MTLDDSVHTFRLRVLARAHALGKVTRACREVGISRTLCYRWRYTAYGADGLHPRRHGPRRGRPSALNLETERAIWEWIGRFGSVQVAKGILDRHQASEVLSGTTSIKHGRAV